MKKIKILSQDSVYPKIMRIKLLNSFFMNEGKKKMN